MRWIVVGAHGMLGKDAVQVISSRGHEVVGVDIDVLDITELSQVRSVITDADVILNCAGYTAVDAAEDNEPFAFAVNAVGPQLLARRAKELGAVIVQISTDYVFSGGSDTPYAEDTALAPLSAYARSKAAGEWAVAAENEVHYIMRTAWLYGAHGNCFPKTMARLAQTHDSLSVVTDEMGQPTWTVDVVELIVAVVEAKAPYGAYHATSSGQGTWFEFTQEIMSSIGKDPAMVTPTTAAAFARKAKRPHYSVLSHARLEEVGIAPIGPWRERWNTAAQTVLENI